MQTKQLSLLFLQNGDEVLLAMKKRGFGAGRWNGVGGKVEVGETIEAAMLREAYEEIMVTPSTYQKVGDIRFDEYVKGERTLMHVHVYVATTWEGNPVETDEMAPKWFDVAALPYDTMWGDDPYWLPQVIAGQKVSADFVLDQDDAILSHDVKIVEGF
jgi:8-oxo-dGTP diphosphatase/2-hydroxy-dATP diphosphatase